MPPTTTIEYVLDGAAERTIAREVALGPPGPGEVVVEVEGCAVGAAPLGREIAGHVVGAGDAAVEWIGRSVIVPRVLPCGECDRCRRGRVAACSATGRRTPDAVARHQIVAARSLLSVEPPLRPAHASTWQLAALADAAALPYAALVRAQLAPGDLCIVVGAGIHGRFATTIARALGAWPVVVDADPAREAAALAAGAHRFLDGAALDAAGARDAAVAAAGGAGLRTVEHKVIETTGTAAGRRRALELLGPGDTAALLAVGEARDDRAPLSAVAALEAQVVGVAACHPDLLPELCALVVRGDVTLAPLVAARPFDALADAVADRRGDRAPSLTILVP